MKTILRAAFISTCMLLPVISSGQDTEAPVLTAISVSPGSVDVASSDAVLTITLAITDDDSGIDFGNIILYDGSGGFIESTYFDASASYLVSGNDTDGTYEVTATLARYSPPGTWEVRVLIFDNAGRERRYGGSGEVFPNPGDQFFTVVNNGTVDTTAPNVSSIGISPASVDTSGASRTLTFDLAIEDPLAGFLYGFIDFYDPSGTYIFSLSTYFADFNLVSGDMYDGTYQAIVDIPLGSIPGTWTVDVVVRDRVGNSATLSGLPGAEFTVTGSSGPSGDISDAIDATQYPFSLLGNEDWFFQTAVTFDGKDAAQSGAVSHHETSGFELTVEGPGILSFWWKVDSEDSADILSVEVVGGTGYNEISGNVAWTQATLTVPAGPQTVRWSYAKDGATSIGADAGWVDRVYFAADSDNELPVLQYVDISPDPVDMSSGDQFVTFTFEVSDDQSGFLEGYFIVNDPFTTEYYYAFFDASDRIDGDAFFGTYEITLDFYQYDFPGYSDGWYVEFGTWSTEVELIEANSLNSRFYGPLDNPFPNPGDELFTVVDGLGPDTQGPTLDSINSITPDPVDISAGPQQVEVSLDLSDNSSGFDYGFVYLYNPSYGFVDSTYFDSSDSQFGDPLSDTYAVWISVPEFGPPGSWTLEFDLYDGEGNLRSYPYDSPFPNPGDEVFGVINNGTSDTTAPVLQSIALTPNTVDTSSGERSITVNLNLIEDISGIRGISISVYDPSGTYRSDLFQYIPGNSALGGTFQATLTIPQGSTEGTWDVAVNLTDEVGNSSRYGRFGSPFPLPGDELFTIGPAAASTYENFVAAYSLSGNDALPGSNPDKDWLINILELLLGTNPTVAEAPDPSLLGTYMSGNQLVLAFTVNPVLSIVPSGAYLDVSDGTGSPFQISGQTSSNGLGGWSDSLPGFISGTTYTVSVTLTHPSRGFVRLKLVP